jgi:hypothetical protein
MSDLRDPFEALAEGFGAEYAAPGSRFDEVEPFEAQEHQSGGEHVTPGAATDIEQLGVEGPPAYEAKSGGELAFDAFWNLSVVGG